MHGALLLFILESWWYAYELMEAIRSKPLYIIGFWLWCFLFSFVHIYLVIMDGWSRFQNYKRAKDQFFRYGFKPRIAHRYIGSKCQRQAALVAAEELGMKDEVLQYYEEQGVKWYHYVPYFMIKDPLFFLKKAFWSRTFLEKRYEPRYDFRSLSVGRSV